MQSELPVGVFDTTGKGWSGNTSNGASDADLFILSCKIKIKLSLLKAPYNYENFVVVVFQET